MSQILNQPATDPAYDQPLSVVPILTGRALDAAIATRILGWKPFRLNDGREILTADGEAPYEDFESLMNQRGAEFDRAAFCPPFSQDWYLALDIANAAGLTWPPGRIPQSPSIVAREAFERLTAG